MNLSNRNFIIGAVVAVSVVFLAIWLVAFKPARISHMDSEQPDDRLSFRSSDRVAGESAGGFVRRGGSEAAARSRALYEGALAKYPDMKPVYRDVPDDQNGYQRLLELAERWDRSVLPEDLRTMLEGDGEWDAPKLRAWYKTNRALVEEILSISALPDRSTKGIALNRVYDSRVKFSLMDMGNVLVGISRIAAGEGDEAGALRNLMGCANMGRHLGGTEAPSNLNKVLEVTFSSKVEKTFVSDHLAMLASDPEQLRKWREVLFPQSDFSGEMRRMFLGEWNYMLSEHIAPFISGERVPSDGSHSIIDPAGFLDTYTGGYRTWMADLAAQEPGRFAVAQWRDAPRGEHLDKDTAAVLKAVFGGTDNLMRGYGHSLTSTTLRSAAISILLGEEMPLDPVSGQPFSWDPATRMLSPPPYDDPEEAIRVPTP